MFHRLFEEIDKLALAHSYLSFSFPWVRRFSCFNFISHSARFKTRFLRQNRCAFITGFLNNLLHNFIALWISPEEMRIIFMYFLLDYSVNYCIALLIDPRLHCFRLIIDNRGSSFFSLKEHWEWVRHKKESIVEEKLKLMLSQFSFAHSIINSE